MEIKVYISLPHNEENLERWRDIMGRLRGMVNCNRVYITSFGESRVRRTCPDIEELSGLLTHVRRFEDVNFIIFGNNWETDRRSQIEHAVAVLYNIPHCGVDELETYFRNYIADTFTFDKNTAEADTDI